jgi:anthranilate phosphoribosyltransferase
MVVERSQLAWFAEVFSALLERRDLTAEQMRCFMQAVMAGHCPEVEAAAILTALRMKGESAEEIAAAAEILRAHMVRLDTEAMQVLDTCGTGGDGAATFNISTAAALVAAGAGVPVVKHGNRAVSSRSGSADVLAALGLEVEDNLAQAQACLKQCGFAFCFAPRFHPALKHVAPVRQRLRVRTLFNCLGPLANPAGAAYQLLGVGRPEWLDPLAGALARLGARHALLVCGQDGLDEVTLASPTLVREVRGGEVTPLEWTPADFDLEPCPLSALRADGPEVSAAMIRAVLEGKDGPATRVVLANAGAALLAADRVASPAEGVARAAEAVGSGRALQVLERLVAATSTAAHVSSGGIQP